MLDKRVFSRAADIIDEKGWWQNPKAADGKECVWTATSAAIREYDLGEDLLEYAKALTLAAGLGDNLTELFHWNDDPNRTQEEVTGLLRTLAE